MCWPWSKKSAYQISYLTPKLVSTSKDGSYWAIGIDRSTNKIYYCKCNQYNDVLYSYPILVLEGKKDESFIVIIQFNCFVTKVLSFARLKSGKIMATIDEAVYFTDGPTTPFIKQGTLMFDMLEQFFYMSQ